MPVRPLLRLARHLCGGCEGRLRMCFHAFDSPPRGLSADERGTDHPHDHGALQLACEGHRRTHKAADGRGTYAGGRERLSGQADADQPSHVGGHRPAEPDRRRVQGGQVYGFPPSVRSSLKTILVTPWSARSDTAADSALEARTAIKKLTCIRVRSRASGASLYPRSMHSVASSTPSGVRAKSSTSRLFF